MILNRWFWFSVVASIFTQSIQWRPAMAEMTFPDPERSDWICYHSGSSIRTYGRMPAVGDTKTALLGNEFLLWAADFDLKLEKSLSAKH